ncbi:MAG: hypothetical protein KC587_04295 [Nitrospira sp.]|nr:hypothetical protein [Nitrospira sp.]
MRSDNIDVDETGVLVYTGESVLRSIKILQKTEDAPLLYLQIFDHASPTVGTTAPSMVLPVPAGLSGRMVPFRYDLTGPQGGLKLGTALTIAVTTSHDGATGPDAGDEPDIVLDYQPLG